MALETTLKLPLSIVSPSDLKRLRRELDDISEALLQMEIRQGGEEQAKLPKSSPGLEALVKDNKLNLLHKDERENLSHLLDQLIDKAPVMHMSFSTEPSPEFLVKLIRYLRSSFDPLIVVTIGLAPSLGAGCMARTTNHVFDLSIKQALLSHKDEFVKAMAGTMAEPAAAASEEVVKA